MSRISYDLKLIKGFVFDVDGVLSPNTVPMGADGIPMRMVNIKDGYALRLAAMHGYRIAIITGADSEAVRHRFSALGISDIYLKASDKLPLLRQWLAKESLQPEEIMYAGDDIPDYESMLAAGLAVAPADAADDIKAIAGYISPCNGGYGVARDIIEQTMRVQGQWMSTSTAFGW